MENRNIKTREYENIELQELSGCKFIVLQLISNLVETENYFLLSTYFLIETGYTFNI